MSLQAKSRVHSTRANPNRRAVSASHHRRLLTSETKQVQKARISHEAITGVQITKDTAHSPIGPRDRVIQWDCPEFRLFLNKSYLAKSATTIQWRVDEEGA